MCAFFVVVRFSLGTAVRLEKATTSCHWRSPSVTCTGATSSAASASARGGFLGTVREIYIDDGKWTVLSKTLFSSLSELIKLSATGNAITHVEGGALRASKKLSALQLDSNKLTTVPPPLQYLKNLRHLGLSNQFIQDLPSRLHLPSLLKLNLQGNKIRGIPVGFLDELNDLQEVRFDGNELATIPPFLFRAMDNLHLVKFNSNKLQTLPRCMFREAFSFGDAPFGRK